MYQFLIGVSVSLPELCLYIKDCIVSADAVSFITEVEPATENLFVIVKTARRPNGGRATVERLLFLPTS